MSTSAAESSEPRATIAAEPALAEGTSSEVERAAGREHGRTDQQPFRPQPAAVTLNGLAISLARALGPGLGGLLLVFLGPGWGFAFNALSFCGVLYVLWDAHLRQHERVTASEWEEAEKAYRLHAGPEMPKVFHYFLCDDSRPPDLKNS